MKNFYQRPLYNSASFFIKVLRYFQEKQDSKLRKSASKIYQSKFNNELFFTHALNFDLKINLYKDSVLSRIIYDGFEQEELSFVKNTLKKGDFFLDIGSNVGLFSLFASQAVGKEGKVIAFEPSPLIFKRLLENSQLNGCENIIAKNIGLSNNEGEMSFYVSDNGHDAWNSFAPSKDNKLKIVITVPVSTLDLELSNVDKSKISLVKIDVEGWEKFVLQGGKSFFLEFNPIVMVEFTDENTFNAGYSVHEIYDNMVAYGYDWFTLVNGELIVESKKMYYPYNNLVAIKKYKNEK